MPNSYTVRAGDTLSSIASEHGLCSWRDIYFYTENSEFRAKRPNPNLIVPGDVLSIPDTGTAIPLPSADVPQFLRLPWNLAAQLQISHLIPLASAPGTNSGDNAESEATSGQRSSQLYAQIMDPSKFNPATSVPLRPIQPMWQFGGSPPLLSLPCGPWGCARGPFHLDFPRPGSLGDVKDALLSVPQLSGALGTVGDYLWSRAPLSRQIATGSFAGLALAGGVTALATSASLRTFALESLNDVEIPVGDAILMIPGLNSRTWVRRVLKPVKFSLLWEEPGPVSGPPDVGTSSGLQGQGGMLILDLQVLGGSDSN